MTAAAPKAGSNPDGDHTDLEAEREFLLRSIRDLDAERAAGEISEEKYRALRDSYTVRAAEVLRQRSASPSPGVRTVASPPPRATVTIRSLAWVALVLAVASGAGFAVSAASGERLPGQEATGSVPLGGADRITRAQLLVREGKVLDALKLYDEVLADDPGNPVALAQRGWLISRAGLVDEGLESIDRAIAADPSYAEAHFFRGMVLWRDKRDPAGGAEEFRLFLENRPPPGLVSFVRDARRQALAEAGTAEPSSPPAHADPPPADPSSPAAEAP